jgi:hypothetical protein
MPIALPPLRQFETARSTSPVMRSNQKRRLISGSLLRIAKCCGATCNSLRKLLTAPY